MDTIIGTHPSRKRGLRPAKRAAAIPFEAHSRVLRGEKPFPDVPLVDDTESGLAVITFGMDGNDKASDCVAAETDHAQQVISQLLTGSNTALTQDQVYELYETQNQGFTADDNPNTGFGSPCDSGMDIQTLLEYLVSSGYEFPGCGKALGFASVAHTSELDLDAATWLGLAIWCGVVLQQAQEGEQFEQGTWNHVPDEEYVGGHGVPRVWFDKNRGRLVTWGTMVYTTGTFERRQMDQAFLVITEAHEAHPGFRDNFDLTSFSQAFTDITGRPFASS